MLLLWIHFGSLGICNLRLRIRMIDVTIYFLRFSLLCGIVCYTYPNSTVNLEF
jgi:hypothetical protein